MSPFPAGGENVPGGMEVLAGARQDLAQPQSERTLDARPPIL